MYCMILLLQLEFDHPSTISRKEQISELLIMKVFKPPITSQFLGPKILFIFLFVRRTINNKYNRNTLNSLRFVEVVVAPPLDNTFNITLHVWNLEKLKISFHFRSRPCCDSDVSAIQFVKLRVLTGRGVRYFTVTGWKAFHYREYN
jgi:hypothetical protein